MATASSDTQATSTSAELPEDAAIRRPSRCARDQTCSHESATHEQPFGAVSPNRCTLVHAQGARTCAEAQSCWSAGSPATTRRWKPTPCAQRAAAWSLRGHKATLSWAACMLETDDLYGPGQGRLSRIGSREVVSEPQRQSALRGSSASRPRARGPRRPPGRLAQGWCAPACTRRAAEQAPSPHWQAGVQARARQARSRLHAPLRSAQLDPCFPFPHVRLTAVMGQRGVLPSTPSP